MRAQQISVLNASVSIVVVSGLSMASPLWAAEIRLLPISASDSHVINGQEITIDTVGGTVTLELRIDDWDVVPDVGYCADGTDCSMAMQDCDVGPCLQSNGEVAVYQLRLDGTGFDGKLTPVLLPANELIDVDNPDYIFFGEVSLPAVDTTSVDWAYGSLVISPLSVQPYAGFEKYAGTLQLQIPMDGAGAYVVGFVDSAENTFLLDGNGINIVPINITPAVINVTCDDASQCDDGNACTDSVCEPDGSCSFPPNYDTNLFCCHPVTGDLTQTSDGNPCTDDVCNADGSVSHEQLPIGTACGDPPVGECDAQDTCTSSGICFNVVAPNGTPCGDDADTDCTDPDTCSGGVCQPNDETIGTACGDGSATDCTDPDTCDGAGECLQNHQLNGSDCDDGLFCTTGELCASGQCVGGAFTCEDNVACTDDSCDDVLDQCDNIANDANCDNGQFCDGAEVCDAVRGCMVPPASIPDCDDGVDCTDDLCDRVNDQCVNVPNDDLCDNGLFCDGMETCDQELGCLSGVDVDCNDDIDCTDDSCDEVNDSCANLPDDLQCADDGLFCNGAEFCNPAAGCDSAGSPCGGPCDEVNDECLCDAPLVEAVGPRYLAVTPQPPGSGPQAILVSPDCPEGNPMYVGAPVEFLLDGPPAGEVAWVGSLTSDPVFLTPEEWGGTVYVRGELLSPETSYIVQGDCGSPGLPALSDSASATTWVWGDVDQNDVANLADVLEIVLAFRGIFDEDRLVPTVDLKGQEPSPCMPDTLINFIDVLGAVTAFKTHPYSAFNNCEYACDR